jgi:hypothetical protein
VFDGVSTVDVAITGCTPTPPPPTTAFPATGQTVIACLNTGQDGDIQAGAALSYTDNGDGTITDNNTGLMWAKQDNNVDPLHDMDTVYTWANAFAVHIAGLNAAAFAGHTDWRLPNVKELQSIVNYQNHSPAVSSEFNSNCSVNVNVLTGSCTAGANYWASSSYVNQLSNPALAWIVDFLNGFVFPGGKNNLSRVRAVRGRLVIDLGPLKWGSGALPAQPVGHDGSGRASADLQGSYDLRLTSRRSSGASLATTSTRAGGFP